MSQRNVVGRPRRIPDILDVIAQLSSDEVPTPPLLARAMLDLLPEDVWSDPTLRWLDPACKYGSILQEVTRRLMVGLADWEPDPGKRAQHILHEQVFGCAITHLTGEMTRRTVYGSRNATSDAAYVQFDTDEGNLPFVPAFHDYPTDADGRASGLCRVCRAPMGLERGVDRENYAYAFIHGAYPTQQMKEQGMRFDIIVANPPYQVGIANKRDSQDANPLYHLFVQHALELSPRYATMVIPSRWFNGGKAQLAAFRETMLQDRRMRTIVDNPKLYDVFPDAEIKGGVNYFLWDREWDGDCEFMTRIDGVVTSRAKRDLRAGDGVLLRDNRAARIIRQAQKIAGSATLEQLVAPRYPFGQSLMSNFKGASAEPFAGSIPLVFASHVGYVRPDQLERRHAWVDKWKVLLPKAGDGHGREVSYVLGEPIALAPGSACTQTYLVAGVFNSAAEAENYANFLCTKLVRFLVLQRKSTQDVRPDQFRFVPALDFTRPWTDANLYTLLSMSEEERAYVDAVIHPRSPILSLDSAIPASHLPGGQKYRAPGSKEAADAEADVDGGDGE